VEASGRQVEGPEDVWKQVEDQEGPEGVRKGWERCGSVRKRSGRSCESVEETGRHRNVMLYYNIFQSCEGRMGAKASSWNKSLQMLIRYLANSVFARSDNVGNMSFS